jgi:hypothetical protein
MDDKKSFLDFLLECGEFNTAQRNCFSHVGDMYMRDFLVHMGLLTDEHANFLWSQYVGKTGYRKERQ